MSLIVNMVRRRLLRKYASTVPTGIIPLQRVHKVLVFVDGTLACAHETVAAVKKYFSDLGVETTVICASFVRGIFPPDISGTVLLSRKNINWTGRIRKGVALKLGLGSEDLFISLFPDNPFAVEFAARSSKAVFKVGRKQCRNNIYDFVMQDGNDRLLSQADAFRQIVNILEKIK